MRVSYVNRVLAINHYSICEQHVCFISNEINIGLELQIHVSTLLSTIVEVECYFPWVFWITNPPWRSILKCKVYILLSSLMQPLQPKSAPWILVQRVSNRDIEERQEKIINRRTQNTLLFRYSLYCSIWFLTLDCLYHPGIVRFYEFRSWLEFKWTSSKLGQIFYAR